jgi:hypothetical protein
MMFQPPSPTSLTIFIEIRKGPNSTSAPGKCVGHALNLCQLDLCWMFSEKIGRKKWKMMIGTWQGDRCRLAGYNE